jgi:hypothetical protein
MYGPAKGRVLLAINHWGMIYVGRQGHERLHHHDVCFQPQCACDNDRLTWDYLLRVLETHLQIFSLILTYVKIECKCKIIKTNKSKGCLVSCNVVRGLSCVHAIPCSFMSCSQPNKFSKPKSSYHGNLWKAKSYYTNFISASLEKPLLVLVSVSKDSNH